jgi:hypothetical protein
MMAPQRIRTISGRYARAFAALMRAGSDDEEESDPESMLGRMGYVDMADDIDEHLLGAEKIAAFKATFMEPAHAIGRLSRAEFELLAEEWLIQILTISRPILISENLVIFYAREIVRYCNTSLPEACEFIGALLGKHLEELVNRAKKKKGWE